MKFILTIDTEGDNQWDYGRELTVENIRFVPRFQNLCEKFLIKPTYLVTSEVCEDPFAKELFSDYLLNSKVEIGAHLHSWTTPPFQDKEGFRYNDINHGYATELPGILLNEKIKNLTNQIETSFGKRPLSFRSGRYGFDENLARILADNSYLVDSSVTPYISWSSHKGIPGGSGGPDFIDKTPFPYTYNFPDGSLLEIPVTILPTRFPLNRNKTIARHFFNNVDNNMLLRILRKLFFNKQPLWLRPNLWMDIHLFDEVVNESINIQLPYIVMIFHSSELMPGCSIYRTDKDSIEKLYDVLESFFILLHNRNIDSVTLTEAAKK
ncbi:MAG: hypothetical protein ABSF81_15765 [Bacteroidales bacterium]